MDKNFLKKCHQIALGQYFQLMVEGKWLYKSLIKLNHEKIWLERN